MTEYDSNGEPVGGTPSAPVQSNGDGGGGSDAAPDSRVGTVFIEWDGDRWEIIEKVTIDFARANAAWNRDEFGDPDVAIGVIRELLAPDRDQMRSLNLTGQTSIDDLVEILNGLLRAAGKAWGTGNFKRSGEQQRSTGRR